MKKPKIAQTANPKDREVRIAQDPESNRDKYPAWQVGMIDIDGTWGWKNVQGLYWWDTIQDKLKNFETMTWQEIYDANGGRQHGNNNHEIPIDKLSKSARIRLKYLGYTDIDTLFSLRLSGTERVWGLLVGNVLKIIWYDASHEVYPTGR